MTNKKQILTTVLSVLISVGLVATVAYATTTIGTNVATGGTLTIGSDGSGSDVIFYSDAAGAYAQWDASESRLYLNAVDQSGANLSPLHAVATIDGATSYYYGLQSDITKSGTTGIDDCTAVTAYLNQTTGDFTLTGRFAPLQAVLSGSGTVGTITESGNGAVYAAWIANRGTQTNTDAVLAVHNQGTTGSTASSGILLDLNTGVTNAIKSTGTVATGIDMGGTYTTTAINLDGAIASTTYNGVNIDLDVPFATVTNQHLAGILIDMQQTSEVASGAWDTSGRMYGIKTAAHADYTITNLYGLHSMVYVDPDDNTDTVNDAVAVYGGVSLTKAFTKGATTSSIAALKGDIWNNCAGAYDGQVFGLMLSYGSNVNYGDTTALIYGYTHADARADYGVYINNYSPYMETGLLLTQQNTSATMQTGIDIDTNGLGADANYYGIDSDVTQQTVSSGAYLSRGNLQGVRTDCYAVGNIDHVYGARIGSTMTMAADSETNQFYGAIIAASASGATHTLTLHDGLVGMQSTVGVDSGVTDVTGGLVAAGFFNSQPIGKNVTSPTYSIYVKAGGYTDYGLNINAESNNLTAGAQIIAYDSAVLPIGLKLTGNTGTITNALNFTGTVTNILDFNSADGSNGALTGGNGVWTAGNNSAGAIKIDVNNTTYYIPYFAAGGGVTGW